MTYYKEGKKEYNVPINSAGLLFARAKPQLVQAVGTVALRGQSATIFEENTTSRTRNTTRTRSKLRSWFEQGTGNDDIVDIIFPKCCCSLTLRATVHTYAMKGFTLTFNQMGSDEKNYLAILYREDWVLLQWNKSIYIYKSTLTLWVVVPMCVHYMLVNHAAGLCVSGVCVITHCHLCDCALTRSWVSGSAGPKFVRWETFGHNWSSLILIRVWWRSYWHVAPPSGRTPPARLSVSWTFHWWCMWVFLHESFTYWQMEWFICDLCLLYMDDVTMYSLCSFSVEMQLKSFKMTSVVDAIYTACTLDHF